MTLRKVPGAAALGLLASLAAHAALYGGAHAMGGAYHSLLAQAALAGGLGLALFFSALAWTGSRGVTAGSVLGARLRERLPSTVATLTSTAFWFAAAETFEPHHAGAPAIAIAAALAVAGWLVLRVARAVADLIADAVFGALHGSFAQRSPFRRRRVRTQPLAQSTARSHRRFARPPPIAIARA